MARFSRKAIVRIIGLAVVLALVAGFSSANVKITSNSIEKGNGDLFWHEGIFQKSNYLPLDGSSSMQGNLNLSGNRLTNVPAPNSPGDAVNKSYVDSSDDQALSDVLTQGNTAGGTNILANAGAAALQLREGGDDHTYMELYANGSAPDTRSGWIGFGGTGQTSLDIENEMGNIVEIRSADLRVASGNLLIPNGILDLGGGHLKGLGSSGNSCSSSNEGSVEYDSSGNIRLCTGSQWRELEIDLFSRTWHFFHVGNWFTNNGDMITIREENREEYLAVQCSSNSGTCQANYINNIENTSSGIEYQFQVYAVDSWDGEDLYFQIYDGSSWQTLESKTGISASGNNYWNNADCDDVGSSYSDPYPNSTGGEFTRQGSYSGRVEKVRVHSNIDCNSNGNQDESFVVEYLKIEEIR